MIKQISIKNFRGIQEIKKIEVERFNIFIGDNGTSKTTLLEGINHIFSPNFLSGRIKHTDFNNGNDEPIDILVKFTDSFKVGIPYGFTVQQVNCDRLFLRIKKRDKKKAGKVFSDSVTLDHIVVPDFPRDEKKGGWSIKMKNEKNFDFTERQLGINQVSTDELPRSFYFGKDRDKQLQKGFNSSFSTIIEDLNWRFSRTIRKETEDGKIHDWFNNINEVSESAQSKVEFDKNEVFKEFSKRTKEFDLGDIGISIIDSMAPFDSSFLSTNKELLNLPIKNMGSGFEMIVSLLFLETLASLSKERLLILIDEPELHLHPRLQESLANYLWGLSNGDKGHQIFVTTHSPIFFKNTIGKAGVKNFVTNRGENDVISIMEITLDSGLFPWSPTWGEVNYFAYNFLTIEFHDELYGFIQEKTKKYKEKELDDYFESNGFEKNISWTREKNGIPDITYDCTLPVFIRNKIHHPENKTMITSNYSESDLKISTDKMIEIVKTLK